MTPRRHCEERKRRSNPFLLLGGMDCFAEFIIGRRFAPTRWLARNDEEGARNYATIST